MSSENQVDTKETIPAPQQEQTKLVNATISDQHIAFNVFIVLDVFNLFGL